MTDARTFGESLRRHRELRGITLDVVAAQTKIGRTFLTALERGDCARWPGGIYSRAWIRAYATATGLDPDEVGARFNRCFAANAFPEGEPAPVTPAKPAGIRPVTPLRLSMESDPREGLRLLQRRALCLTADLAIALTMATLVANLAPVDFWTMFSAGVVTCHAVGLFGGGGSMTGWLERRVRRHARPHDEHVGAVAEAA